MHNNKQFKLIIVLFAIFLVLPVYPNPFTGNKNSPTPVYQKKPSETNLNFQRSLNEKLGFYISEWKENRSLSVLFVILGISFLYGIIHAAGPGHRKTIVFSFYLTRKAKPIEPLLTGLKLAALHGGSAALLILIFKGLTGAVSANSNDTMIYMEGISFFILIGLSIYGIVEAILDLKKKKIDHKENIKLGAILVSGIYPCPAAMLVLVLALSLDVINLGIVAVIVMSMGMSIPIILAAYLAWAGRTGFFYKLKAKEKTAIMISSVLQILGFGILLFLSIKTAFPFIAGLFKI